MPIRTSNIPARIHQQYWRQLLRNDNVRELLAQNKLDMDDVDTNSRYVDWSLFRHEVEILINAGISPKWLFDIASSLNTATHGPLGLAALSAETVEQAIQIITSHTQSRQTVVEVSLQQGAHYSEMLFTANVEVDEVYYLLENVTQLVITQIVNSMSVPKSTEDLKIYCGDNNPDMRAALMNVGDLPCHFDCAQSKIVFSQNYLRSSSDYADQSTCETNLVKCYKDKIHSLKDDRSLTEKINSLFDDYIAIRQLELNNHLQASAAPTVESVADTLHISARTLHRKLQESNHSFKKLWQDYKLKQAKSYLHNSEKPVAEIAELLGYQDTGNFVRAFKQWTQQTPASWRQTNLNT